MLAGPVVETLRMIGESLGRRVVTISHAQDWCKRDDIDLAIADYAQDFSRLWGLDGTGGLSGVAGALASSSRGNQLTLLIVWDAMPVSPPEITDITRHVSPYEFAGALSLATYARAGDTADARDVYLRILILDLWSHSFSIPTFLTRSLFAFHNLLPWVQSYLPVAVGKESFSEAAMDAADSASYAWMRQAIPPSRQTLEHLVDDLYRAEAVLTMFPEGSSQGAEALSALAFAWKQEFLKAGDRHDIANLVGPLQMIEALPEEHREAVLGSSATGSALQLALIEILRQVGLIPRKKEVSTAKYPAPVLRPLGGDFGRRKGVNFLLVDDQYRLGFHHVLGSTVFGSKYRPQDLHIDRSGAKVHINPLGSIECVADPAPVLAGIESLGVITDEVLPRELKIERCDVLVLDLRLWHGADVAARRQFFGQVLHTCKSVRAEQWRHPAFQTAYDAASRICEGVDCSELPALALLPLLINICDPSFPVVLFSSTHQRDVYRLFDGRPCLITRFCKPLISGYGSELAHEQVIRELHAAIARAVELHESRLLWERIVATHWDWCPPFKIDTFNQPVRSYNMPGSESFAPSIAREELRRRLASIYCHYVVQGRYWDFSTLPYELIESSLNPSGMNNGDSPRLLEGGDVGGRRNKTAKALKHIRNRKAHGRIAPPASEQEGQAWRRGAILQFMLLLDYLEGISHSSPGIRSILLRQRKEARERFLHNGRRMDKDDVPWPSFVPMEIAEWVVNGCSGDEVNASKETVSALLAILKD